MKRFPSSWLHWFSGFVDGEGCFLLHVFARQRYLPQPRFMLSLRIDDAPILEEISKTLAVGKVFYPRHRHVNPQGYKSNLRADYHVYTKDGTQLLVDIFSRYPLRTKKQHDLIPWSEAVRIWNSHEFRGKAIRYNAQVQAAAERMRELVAILRDGRDQGL